MRLTPAITTPNEQKQLTRMLVAVAPMMQEFSQFLIVQRNDGAGFSPGSQIQGVAEHKFAEGRTEPESDRTNVGL